MVMDDKQLQPISEENAQSPTVDVASPSEGEATKATKEGGFVYFIGSGHGSPVKIGWAADPERRLCALQVGNPYKLTILARQTGTEKDERALHRQFKAHRLAGEWFEWHDELAAYIRQVEPHRRMTLQDVAAWLKIKPRMVSRDVRNGILRGTMVAGELQFETDAVKAWGEKVGIRCEVDRNGRWKIP